MAQKSTLAASVQKKNGRLYAVIQAKENGKTKSVWRSLGLPEGASQTQINKAFRINQVRLLQTKPGFWERTFIIHGKFFFLWLNAISSAI